MAIEEIAVRAVRGIRHEIRLRLGGKSLLIQGDNGTGKSSIERALRWALLKTDAPNCDKPFSTEASFRRHILETEDKPRVEVTLCKGGTIEAWPDGENVNPAGQSYQAACCVANPFLRRLELLDFLNSKPVDRFKYLDSFLDLGIVDQALRDIAISQQAAAHSTENTAKDVQRRLTAIANLLPQDLQPTEMSSIQVDYAIAEMGRRLKLTEDALLDWPKIVAAGRKARDLSTGDDLEQRRMRLTTAEGSVGTLSKTLQEKGPRDLAALEDKRKELEQVASCAKIATLLEHAKKHLELNQGQTCPLCGQSVNRANLLDSITIRLQESRNTVTSLTTFDVFWELGVSFGVYALKHFRPHFQLARSLAFPTSPTLPNRRMDLTCSMISRIWLMTSSVRHFF